MKIYVITKGFYSDYHICAVTTNEEKAEKLKNAYTDNLDKAEIEIYEDDETDNEPRIAWYYDYRTNKAEPREFAWDYDKGEMVEKEKVIHDDETVTGAVVFAKDKNHAKRKAQDMIAMYKAEKAGIC